jgi:hypothetical protein
MRRALLLVFLVAACATAGTARADGDPASDYLLQTLVFFPFDAKIPVARQRETFDLVNAANKSGYKIRAAIIWSAYDLGAVTSLWRKPRTYARFLGTELRYVYTGRLLIVMPNGFGFYWKGHPDAQEYAVLSKIKTGTSPNELVEATQKAVVALAGANGVTVEGKGGGAESRTKQRVIIVIAAVGAVFLAVGLRVLLRRRQKTESSGS